MDVSLWQKAKDAVYSTSSYSKNLVLANAAALGYPSIVQYLTENGGDVNAFDGKALIAASQNGHLNTVRYLVEHGANVHARDEKALRRALLYHQVDVIEYLVTHGGDINAGGDEFPGTNKDMLLSAASLEGSMELVKYALDNKANVHYRRNMALKNAAQNNHLGVVKYLLRNGADINDSHHGSVVELAIKNNNYDIAKYLVEQGADIRSESTPILIATIRNNQLGFIKYLVSKGIYINMEDLKWVINDPKTDKTIVEYLNKTAKKQGVEKAVRKIGRESIRKKKLKTRHVEEDITEWQRYCKVISNETNLMELRKISQSVGLPIKDGDRYLPKNVLCAQLAIQMETMLAEPPAEYDHSTYCNNIEEYDFMFDTDLNEIPKDCLVKDSNGRCFYVGDIVDNNFIRPSMRLNPYTKQPWELTDMELIKKRQDCLPLQQVHQTYSFTREDLQKQIVTNILIELDKVTRTSNTDILLEADFDQLNKIVQFFQNKVLGTADFKHYTKEELNLIENNQFEIDMLAEFLSITRGKIGDDVIFSTFIDQFLKGDQIDVEEY